MLDFMTLPLKRYADFSGRSRRMEYWSFTVLNFIVMIVLFTIMMAGGFSAASLAGGESANPEAILSSLGPVFYIGAGLLGLWVLAVFIPGIAVTVRRFHDRDLSGWWYLGGIVAGMIPFIGFLASIAILVLMFLPGTPGPNRFGPDPKDPGSSNVFS